MDNQREINKPAPPPPAGATVHPTPTVVVHPTPSTPSGNQPAPNGA